MTRLLALGFVGGIATATAVWLAWPQDGAPRTAAELMDVVMWGREPIGASFALVDHTGRPRTDADFRGKLLLIYFGFTSCSDICPLDLQSIAAAIDKLGAAGEAVQPLFITIDPEHDTPEQLRGYVSLFHPRLIGLTGDARQVRQVARAYKVYYAKSEPAKKADLQIDHSGLAYLVDAGGRYTGFVPPGTSADRIASLLRSQLAGLAQR